MWQGASEHALEGRVVVGGNQPVSTTEHGAASSRAHVHTAQIEVRDPNCCCHS